MIEPELAFADIFDDMTLAEALFDTCFCVDQGVVSMQLLWTWRGLLEVLRQIRHGAQPRGLSLIAIVIIVIVCKGFILHNFTVIHNCTVYIVAQFRWVSSHDFKLGSNPLPHKRTWNFSMTRLRKGRKLGSGKSCCKLPSVQKC